MRTAGRISLLAFTSRGVDRSLEPLVGKLSQLRNLYLHRMIDNATQLEPIRCFQTAPNLREVDISFDHRSLFLPWSQLTHCTLSYLNISSFAEIIRLASSLIYCMLDLCQLDSEAPHRFPISLALACQGGSWGGGNNYIFVHLFTSTSRPIHNLLSGRRLASVSFHRFPLAIRLSNRAICS